MQFYYRYSFENPWSRSRDINEEPFRTKHVLINISRTAPPIFKFKVSMALSHQARLNGVVLLKINGAVHEILMKNMWPLGHMWPSSNIFLDHHNAPSLFIANF